MSKPVNRGVSITGIEEFTNIKLGEPVRDAAGMLGVKEALKHGFKEMGVLRSMGALLKMNQKDGFDCPSCAWPDPENRSNVGHPLKSKLITPCRSMLNIAIFTLSEVGLISLLLLEINFLPFADPDMTRISFIL